MTFTPWAKEEDDVIINYLRERDFPRVSSAMILEMLGILQDVSTNADRSYDGIRCRVSILKQKGIIPEHESSGDKSLGGENQVATKTTVKKHKRFIYKIDEVLSVLVEEAKKQHAEGKQTTLGLVEMSYGQILEKMGKGSSGGLTVFLWKAAQQGHLKVLRKGTSDKPTTWDLRQYFKSEGQVIKPVQTFEVAVTDDAPEQKNSIILAQINEVLIGAISYCKALQEDLELDNEATGLREALKQRDEVILTLEASASTDLNQETKDEIGQIKANLLRSVDEYKGLPLWRKRDGEELFLEAIRNGITELVDKIIG